MKRNYLKVREFLEVAFPELRGRISGENYPPPPIVGVFLNILSVVQLLFILAMLMGDSIWNLVKVPNPPQVWYKAKEYGMQVAILVFLIVPQLLNGFIISGAFEVALDGAVVFSKLNVGRLPNMVDLTSPLENAGLIMAQQM